MKSAMLKLTASPWLRGLLCLAGMTVLALVYLFQGINLAAMFGASHPNAIFIINRTSRLILNDLACFLIILGLFWQEKYLKIAFWAFLVELLVILPVYLAIKLSIEGDSEISSPLLSQLHRLIVNPMLMILLMAGFFYQRLFKR